MIEEIQWRQAAEQMETHALAQVLKARVPGRRIERECDAYEPPSARLPEFCRERNGIESDLIEIEFLTIGEKNNSRIVRSQRVLGPCNTIAEALPDSRLERITRTVRWLQAARRLWRQLRREPK